ncbi:hypothetical protein GCM10018966_067800 [Streptomyces yanii]
MLSVVRTGTQTARTPHHNRLMVDRPAPFCQSAPAATVFAINPAGPVDWGDLAGGAGYFDQAHFGHEFRAFTGLTPTRYVEVRRRFLREHPGHALDGCPLPAD